MPYGFFRVNDTTSTVRPFHRIVLTSRLCVSGGRRLSSVVAGRPASVGPRAVQDVGRGPVRDAGRAAGRRRRGDVRRQQDHPPGAGQAVRPEFHRCQRHFAGDRQRHTGKIRRPSVRPCSGNGHAANSSPVESPEIVFNVFSDNDKHAEFVNNDRFRFKLV